MMTTVKRWRSGRAWLGVVLVPAMLLAACSTPAASPTAAPKAPAAAAPTAAPAPAAAAPTVAPAAAPSSKPAAAPAAAAPATGQPYKIGATLGLTGAAATWGAHMKDGLLLAVNEINKAGGVGGRPIEPVIEDIPGFQPRPAVEAFTKLIDVDKVPVIITAGSSAIPAVLPIAEPKKVVTFNSAARLPQSAYEGQKFFFSNIMVREQEAQAMVDFADKAGYKTAVISYSNDAWGQGMQALVKQAWEAKGHKFLLVESHEQDQKDFRTSMVKFRDLKPDVFFWLVYTWQVGALGLQQAQEAGWKPPVTIGPDMLVADDLLKQAAKAAEGIVIVSAAWDPFDTKNPKEQAYKDAFKKAYGYEADGWSTTVYDAAYIIADAIKRGGYTGEGIANAMRSMPAFDGAAGLQMTFDPKLGTIKKLPAYVTVKNGQYATYTR